MMSHSVLIKMSIRILCHEEDVNKSIYRHSYFYEKNVIRDRTDQDIDTKNMFVKKFMCY